MVETYEISGFSPIHRDTHADLGAASAALPPGAYTTFRNYGGERILRLDRHLQRLEESLAPPVGLDRTRARSGIRWCLARGGHPESRVRLTHAPPHLFLSLEPFHPLPATVYREGVRCVTVPVRRANPRAKDTRFLPTAQGAYAMLPAGVNEGLMVDDDGAVLEGLSSNVFAVMGGSLRTEEARVLQGVTRSVILEVAAGVLPVRLEAVHQGELARLTECFITSVSREILPVTGVDDVVVGDGRVGPVTRELARRLAALVDREAAPA
jgi:branched-subunit amino acid aminotransferase/4-amino-4-deoxychorismate lyase